VKVLVTGGCGFLGSHICEYFRRLGWHVIAYDNMTKFETSRIQFGDKDRIRNYNREHLAMIGVEVVRGDIMDDECLFDWAECCDYIVNCAAQPTMTLSSEDPVFDFETNVWGMVNILEAARKFNIPVATCSSIHIYGTGINKSLNELNDTYMRPSPLIDENHPILTGELTPLHASKACAEIYTRMYSETYEINTAVFRLTGIYGERQFGSEDHGWVSLMAIKTMLGLPIQLIGTGKQVRDILYVTDATRAFHDWLNAGCPSGIYNIGGGKSNIISVMQCIMRLGLIMNKSQCILKGGERRGDLLYFACDNKKATEAFGWKPTIKPDEGLERMALWLQDNKDIFNVLSPVEEVVQD
jgi:CDP-paratose 2-epimerase